MGDDRSMTVNVRGALAYLLVPAIIFIVLDRNEFVRFHSLQDIALTICYLLAHLAAFFLGGLYLMESIAALLHIIINAVFLVLVIICSVKAYQGKEFKLFLIGRMANRWK